jgi:hypothetical protein
MEILLNAANDIYTVNMDVVSKVLIISGCNNFPLDVSSLKEIYDTTHPGPIGLPSDNQFAWFRSNGLPVFVWGINNLPAGAANGDALNVMLSIPVNQSQLSLQQKQASASAGVIGTLVSNETPTGAIDGSNQTFTLANTPIKGAITLVYTPSPATQPTVFLIYNIDFTVVGNVITTVAPPLAGSTLKAVYYH